MPRIDEVSRRREGFRPEVPVRLSDGQEWSLPLPRVMVRPTFAAGSVALARRIDLGPEYEALLDRYYAAEGEDQVVEAMLLMARALILANYDLSDDELGDLLLLADGPDAENEAMWATIQRAVSGRAPKASGDTSGPA